jgi:hypothetical protein
VINSRIFVSSFNLVCSAARVAVALPILWAAVAQGAKGGNVMVHGGGRTGGPNPTNPIWISSNITDPKDPGGVGTMVLFREKIGEDKWHEFYRIAFTVVEISSQSSELVILKDNRTTWAWFSASSAGDMRFSYGPELPERQRMLAVAGDKKTLWAMALPSAKSTQPAATQASTGPTTRGVAPILFQLIGSTWTPHDAPLPAGVFFETPEQVSMTVINENPTLAINTGNEFIQLLQYSKGARRWEKLPEGKIQLRQKPQAFKALNLAEQPAIWFWADLETFGEVWTPGGNMMLPANPGVATSDADVTVAGDTIWLVYRNQGKLFQQRFNRDGSKADEQAAQVQWTRPPSGPGNTEWLTIVVMTVLVMGVLMVLLKRRAAANKEENSEGEE